MLSLSLALLCAGPTAMAQPIFQYVYGNVVSDFFVLGNTQSRHNQTLYRPGSFGPGFDSTTLYLNTLFFQYGQNSAGSGNNTLDSITIRLGHTDSLHHRNTPNGRLFVPDNDLTLVFTRAQLVIPEGMRSNWFALPLAQSFPYKPLKTLVLDIKFKSSANELFSTVGDIRVNSYIRISSRRFSDTAGGLSEVIPVIGFNGLFTGNSPAITTASLLVWPNPAQGQVTISASQATLDKPYRVLDAAGRVVSQGVLSGHTTVKLLTPGLYLLKAEGESRKIVVE